MLRPVVRAVVVVVAGVSFGLVGVAGDALAQSEMKKDGMKKDEMKKDEMKKDEMKKDEMMKKEELKGEMAKDPKAMIKDDKMEKKP